jgi:hypothetical protein
MDWLQTRFKGSAGTEMSRGWAVFVAAILVCTVTQVHIAVPQSLRPLKVAAEAQLSHVSCPPSDSDTTFCPFHLGRIQLNSYSPHG